MTREEFIQRLSGYEYDPDTADIAAALYEIADSIKELIKTIKQEKEETK